MEEPEYYRALNRLFKKLSQRRDIENLINELEEQQNFINELKDIKTVKEFLDKTET